MHKIFIHTRILLIVTAFIIIFTLATSTVSYGNTMTVPIEPYGVSRPINIWNIAKKGPYSSNSYADNYDKIIYSQYKFNGNTKYTIHIKNTGKKTLYVKAFTGTNTNAIFSTTIKANSSRNHIINRMNKTTSFYLTFKGSPFYITVK